MRCRGQRKRFTVGEIPRVIWAKAIFTPDEISSVAHKIYERQVVNLHLALQTFAIKSGRRGSKSCLLFLKKILRKSFVDFIFIHKVLFCISLFFLSCEVCSSAILRAFCCTRTVFISLTFLYHCLSCNICVMPFSTPCCCCRGFCLIKDWTLLGSVAIYSAEYAGPGQETGDMSEWQRSAKWELKHKHKSKTN